MTLSTGYRRPFGLLLAVGLASRAFAMDSLLDDRSAARGGSAPRAERASALPDRSAALLALLIR